MVIEKSDVIGSASQNKYQLFIRMIEVSKSIIVLKARLKNRMPLQKRRKLEQRLKLVELKSYYILEAWGLLEQPHTEKPNNPNLSKLLMLFNLIENEPSIDQHEVNGLLEKYSEQFGNSPLDLHKIKQQLNETQDEFYKRLDRDYLLFLHSIKIQDHPLHSKEYSFKNGYVESLGSLLDYISPMYRENINVFKDKFGITSDLERKSLQEIQEFCAPRLILDGDYIQRESWNILLLTEALLLIPTVLNSTDLMDSDLLSSLGFGKKEVNEIIHFTNLLKIGAYEHIGEFTKITKYAELELYKNEYKLHAFKELEPSNRVLVMGTMSAGKSTFLNSLLGHDFFPSKNEACTAKVFEYSITDRERFAVWNNEKKDVETFDHLTSETVAEWNETEKIHTFYIKGPSHTPIYTNKKLTLIDTPGPNNSMDANHRKIMEQALNGDYEKIFYLLNSTQLGTDDDLALLQHIQDVLKKAPTKQIYFIVNKVDEFDNNDRESLKELKENVLAYLQAKGFQHPNVLFVSALTAKLVQNDMNGIAMSRKERGQLRFLEEIMLEEAYDLSKLAHYSERNLQNVIEFTDQITDKQKELLLHSGITEVMKCL
ncbi:dynamin family protein [Ureibacillus sp. NPDC094379]